MSDIRPPRHHDERPARPAPGEVSLTDLVEGAVRKLSTGIMIAGALIGLAVYFQEGDEAPRYQVTAADGRIIRVNTDNGTVIACERERCAIVLQRGQRLDDDLPSMTAPAVPPPAAQPALPAPKAAAGNEAAAAAAAEEEAVPAEAE